MDRTITLSRGRGSMEKNVLITGSSSGFGMYSALELAKCGYTIYASMRNVEKQTQLMERSGTLSSTGTNPYFANGYH